MCTFLKNVCIDDSYIRTKFQKNLARLIQIKTFFSIIYEQISGHRTAQQGIVKQLTLYGSEKFTKFLAFSNNIDFENYFCEILEQIASVRYGVITLFFPGNIKKCLS